jgi:ATP-binding cassette subfamily F protein 3
MSILTTHNLSLSFGDFDLFQGISVNIEARGKIGLIGPNGIGKTSLMLIMAGINAPTAGSVQVARNRRIGYLRQEAVDAFAARENTVYGEMLTVFAHLREQQEHLHQLEAQMAAGDYTEALLKKYGELQTSFEHAGGYNFDVRIQRTLQGLGLGEQHWEMPISHLSGGQKTRALLARLLLEKPDLLMLDEPTNHLDTEAIEWLEHTLSDWEGAVLVASHDRFFLDNAVETIWEMSRTGIETYPGNYSAYLLQRDQKWEYYQRVFKEEKARLLKEVDFIQRNWVRASTHARALGLLRRLSRDLAIVDTHGVMGLRSGKKWSETELDKGPNAGVRLLDVTEAIRKVNAIEMPGRPPRIRPRLTPTHTSGNIVLRVDGVQFGYPGHPLFHADQVELHRGECVALIGPNGSGKTTFIRTLLKELTPLKGQVHPGASLKIGYFAQAHDALNPKISVLDELLSHKGMPISSARSYLAQYLFRGDDVFKPVSALSGGERGRLALAILALDGANFLLLDEPTNHLDLPAQEVLQELLQNFPGTILLVSHDRYLIDRLATQIWALRDGQLNVFQGSYRQFILQRAELNEQTHKILFSPKPLARDNSRETRKQQQALERLEARIHEHEQTMRMLNKALQKASNAQPYDQVQKLSWKYAQAQSEMEDLMAEWEQLAV